eukprot:4800528-Lingulodinium_polyedra.AAC.1
MCQEVPEGLGLLGTLDRCEGGGLQVLVLHAEGELLVTMLHVIAKAIHACQDLQEETGEEQLEVLTGLAAQDVEEHEHKGGH